MMFRPLHIAVLEFKRMLANRGELGFAIALPIVLFALMYAAFGSGQGFSATANIVDRDGGAPARELVRQLYALESVTVEEWTEAGADAALDDSDILLAIIIPPGFSQAWDAAGRPRIIFKQRGYGGDEGQVVAGLVQGLAAQLGQAPRLRNLTAAALSAGAAPGDTPPGGATSGDAGAATPGDTPPGGAASGTTGAGAPGGMGDGIDAAAIDAEVGRQLAAARARPPVPVEIRRLGGAADDPLLRMLPGVLVMFLMFAVTLGAQALVDERFNGTLERLLTTRLSVNQLFLGKFLAGLLRSAFQVVILLALALILLRVGGVAGFFQSLAFLAATAAAVNAIGLVIAGLARTREQAIWGAVFITMAMTVFGGAFFDVGEQGPLAVAAQFTISHYAIEAVRQMLVDGAGLGQQWPGLGVMAGVTAAGLTLARLLFRRAPGGGRA